MSRNILQNQFFLMKQQKEEEEEKNKKKHTICMEFLWTTKKLIS